jgi:hypothetical protein
MERAKAGDDLDCPRRRRPLRPIRVRAKSAWFRGVQVRQEGRIRAGGVEKDVIFMDADPGLNDEIDAAYRAKYRRHGAQYVNMMVSPEARSATIKLAPRFSSS